MIREIDPPMISDDLTDAENCPFPFGQDGFATQEESTKSRWKMSAKKLKNGATSKGRKARKSRQKLLLQGPVAAFTASAQEKKWYKVHIIFQYLL